MTLLDVFRLLFPTAYAAALALDGDPSELAPLFDKTELAGWVSGHARLNEQLDRSTMSAWVALREFLAGEFGVDGHGPRNAVWHLPPRSPYDVFAIAAYLLEHSGAYHHVQPTKVGSTGHAQSPRHIAITTDDLKRVEAAAAAWRGIPVDAMRSGNAGRFVDHLRAAENWRALRPLFESWDAVYRFNGTAGLRDARHAEGGNDAGLAPAWWWHAWRLLAIADEASCETWFVLDPTSLKRIAGAPGPWFETMGLAQMSFAVHGAGRNKAGLGELDDLHTLSGADRDVACVLPKSRTSSVGCTLRSLSHHLALLPGIGTAKAGWTPSYGQPTAADPMPLGRLNVLLVPFPYSIGASAFRQKVVEQAPPGKAKYGYFDVDQNWLRGDSKREEIITFLSDLISAARAEVEQVNAIVFPELSLDYPTFEAIKEFIQQKAPEIELLVGGVSSNRHDKLGNFVSVASFAAAGRRRELRESTREKHHRWKIEGSQITEYGLAGVLSPELSWWEDIDLEERRVNFTVFRDRSVLAALICEDLARIDPCHQLVRAIGPNLVIAILMDAPQVSARWPARYATVLAEDPGCSVLTLTSRGLMTRQHRAGTFKSGGNREVAMWRDDSSSKPLNLDCPYDAQALVLTLVEREATDHALDGRMARGRKAWRHAGHLPIRVGRARKKHADILGEDDLSCWS